MGNQVLNLDNGDKYKGDVVDGKKHGKGRYTFANGNKYEGSYKDDKMNGKGRFTFKAEGNEYEGDFVK